ncbi:hypothetical protein F5I97DRAFT_1808491 [Phlebopus sp. FC_14]|nr:hypothetical protein F5I97DRAFT_1808491 [Phlebopus sp. FC_14]
MQTFMTMVLPVMFLHYSMAVLVQLKGTAMYRTALLPILFWSAYHAASSVDISGGDPMQVQTNATFITQLFSFAMRATIWATAQEPYRRLDPPHKLNRRGEEANGLAMALWNAFDLLVNLRGIGWNWPQGLHIPASSDKSNSRLLFVVLCAGRFAAYAFAYDATLEVIRLFSPERFSGFTGGIIYDASLTPAWHVLRCVSISFLAMWMIYFAVQWMYYFAAAIFVTVFQQHPSQWPPVFDAPWLSTSLRDFWSHRWHQTMRHIFLSLGGQPSTYIFGRAGGVIGGFLFSGIFHDIELRAVGKGGNSLVVIGFFVMNGVGILLEWVWKRVMGKAVGGVFGWMWTFSWMAMWGVAVVNEWAKIARFGAHSSPWGFRPAMLVWSYVQSFLQK